MLRMPYFMKNKEWYKKIPDPERGPYETKIILTDKAPRKAKLSYYEFMRVVNGEDIIVNGEKWHIDY